MKKKRGENGFPQAIGRAWPRALMIMGVWFALLTNFAQASAIAPGGSNSISAYPPLNFWAFGGANFWVSGDGAAPISFTNLSSNWKGDGTDLVVNNPGSPAWLQFPVVEPNGTTNLSVNIGSVTFWYAPGWSGTNLGGSGPAAGAANLLTVGGYTTNSSFGWWCLYVNAAGALSFSAQTNDLSDNCCTYVSAPVAWTTNFWHFIALTYSTTNTALYVDGDLAATGQAITNYPGGNALANGFFIGSDTNGILQAEGMIDDLYTYNVPLDADAVYSTFDQLCFAYYANPLNEPEFVSAPSTPSTSSGAPDAITGSGDLQWVANASCVYGTNAYQVWLTNVKTANAGNGVINVTFTIQGGLPGNTAVPFDVFANSELSFGPNGVPWSWMGQGFACNTYNLPITDSADVFLIVGTPQDSENSDLTDAYQNLVSKTNPNNPYGNPDGLLTGWEVLLGLNPNNSNLTQPGLRANYGYTPADWLNGVSGIKSGTVGMDNEGNVLQVSQ